MAHIPRHVLVILGMGRMALSTVFLVLAQFPMDMNEPVIRRSVLCWTHQDRTNKISIGQCPQYHSKEGVGEPAQNVVVEQSGGVQMKGERMEGKAIHSHGMDERGKEGGKKGR